MLDDLKTQIQNERRWYLKSLGILTFHTLMQASKTDKRNFKWRIGDTAKELDLSIGYVSESLKLAKAIGKDESLKFVTRDEALSRLKKDE